MLDPINPLCELRLAYNVQLMFQSISSLLFVNKICLFLRSLFKTVLLLQCEVNSSVILFFLVLKFLSSLVFCGRAKHTCGFKWFNNMAAIFKPKVFINKSLLCGFDIGVVGVIHFSFLINSQDIDAFRLEISDKYMCR